MNLQAMHARALASMQKVAAPAVTFTLENPGTHEPTTGRFANPTTETVAGYAIKVEVSGAETGLQGGETIEANALRLFFVPNTLGDMPKPLSYVTWSGVKRRVASTRSVAPDGPAIASYVELE